MQTMNLLGLVKADVKFPVLSDFDHVSTNKATVNDLYQLRVKTVTKNIIEVYFERRNRTSSCQSQRHKLQV